MIISDDGFNHGLSGLVIVIPITSKRKNIPSNLEIHPPEGGLTMISFIKCEDVRSISKDRLIRYSGAVSDNVLLEVDDRLRLLLRL